MTVEKFEEKVWGLEGIRVIVRASTSDTVKDYNYRRRAQGTWRITQLLKKRINSKVGKKKVVVIEGNGEEPHGRTLLRTLRKSYK